MSLTASPSAPPPATDEPRVYRILLVDAHRILRQALRVLLADDREFVVVGETGRAAEALELIRSLHPDVVVTDFELPDGGGSSLIERMRASCPGIAVLVLTALRARGSAAAARKAGARGFLHKDRGREELSAALREVTAGRWYCPEAPLAAPARGRRDLHRSSSDRASYLTERQRQVLRSLALGHSTREIARVLGVSVRAVHKQRERLRLTLQLDSTAALTRFAVREGLIAGHAAGY
jgi:DNA-binding NarL/FixJ family response regulator